MFTCSRNNQIKRRCQLTRLLKKFTVMNCQGKIHYTTKFEDITVETFFKQFADRTDNAKINNEGTEPAVLSTGVTTSIRFSALSSFTPILGFGEKRVERTSDGLHPC